MCWSVSHSAFFDLTTLFLTELQAHSFLLKPFFINSSQICSFLCYFQNSPKSNITQTGVKGAFVRNNFQLWIKTHLLLSI